MAVPGIEMPKDRPIFDVQSPEQACGGEGELVQYAPLFTVTVIGGPQPVERIVCTD